MHLAAHRIGCARIKYFEVVDHADREDRGAEM